MSALRGLFARIFVSIWLLMTGIVLAFAGIHALAERTRSEGRAAFIENFVRSQGELASYRAAAGQREAAERSLRALRARSRIELHVLLPGQPPLGGAPSAALAAQAARLGAGAEARFESGPDADRVALREGDAVIVARVPHPSAFRRLGDAQTLASMVGAIVLLSGLASYLLARYLTRQLDRLGAATRRFADGDLSTRVGPARSGAASELIALGEDFDRMAERIEGLLAAHERLLRDVSHELRSPLARLAVALELARDGAAERSLPHLDRVGLEAGRLEAMIQRILTVARLQQAQVTLRERVELGALLDEVARDARYEAGDEGRVVLALEADGSLLGDPTLMRQAFDNVVRNALAVSEPGRSIALRLYAEGDETRCVEIRDHGPGVPEAELSRIFEPFYRVDAARGRGTGGAGIGLAICQLAVRMHGGEVWADNAPGGGLVVTMRLPLAR